MLDKCMISFNKLVKSLLVLISGLFMLIVLYSILIFHVNLIHGKSNLLIVMMLLLTNVILVGSAFVFGSVLNFAESTKKHILIAVRIISLFPTTYFGYGMYGNFINWSFTAEKWQSHPQERVYMVDEMLEKVELRGKTREEIGLPVSIIVTSCLYAAFLQAVLPSEVLCGY